MDPASSTNDSSPSDAIRKFVDENIVRRPGGWFTLQMARDAYQKCLYYDHAHTRCLKRDLEMELGTTCCIQKRMCGHKEVNVFDGFVIKEYDVNGDIVGDWLQEKYERTCNSNEYVTFMELFDAFKSDTSTCSYTQSMFSMALHAHLGNPSSLNGRRTYRRLRRKEVTREQQEMGGMNLEVESKFVRDMILARHHDPEVSEQEITLSLGDLMPAFLKWLEANHLNSKHTTSRERMGRHMTKLVWDETKHTGFKAITKKRTKAEACYVINTELMISEMVQKKWISADDV
jgi:hypothetical protein